MLPTQFLQAATVWCQCKTCDTTTVLSLGFGIPDVEDSTNFYDLRDVMYDPTGIGWLITSNWSGSVLPTRSPHPCPDLIMIYGTRGAAPKFPIDLTGIACYQKADEVNANISYAIPQRIITNVSVLSSSPAPLPLWPANSGETSSGINNFIAMEAPDPYNSLAMAVLNSSNSAPAEFFTSSNALIIADRVSQIYNNFLTQYYSQAIRNSTFLDGESRQVPAVLVDKNRQRLVQNRLSTSILEGLLAVIWLCTVVAILLSRTKNLLPENPCSIAAQARLFADSQLLSLIPGDIGHLTNKQLARETPFVDHMFSLGWWEVDGKETRRFGIDVGQALFE